VLKKLGSGAYGHVWKVQDRKTREVLALKKIFDAFQHSTDAQRTFREVMFLRQFNHPNIIKLKGLHRAENDKDIYLVFEYMEADLHGVIRENILNPMHKKCIIYQFVKAVRYLHASELIHRDLKPSNILLNSDCRVKLCDFGLIRSIDMPKGEEPVMTEYVATRWYRAPELLLGSTSYTKAVDQWSLGCMLGEMVRGKSLFPGNSTLNQLERIISFTGWPSKEEIESMSSSVAHSILSTVPKVRKKSLEEWFPNAPTDMVWLISSLLQFDPRKRLSIQEVLEHPYLS
jgi:mitogen-activated protein kinase 15